MTPPGPIGDPTQRVRRRVVVAALLFNVFAFVAVACGVPTGESSFEPVDAAEMQGINDSTSTTSTTTTTTTTSTVPEMPDSLPESTTTSSMPPQTMVTLYFIARGTLQPTQRPLIPNYTPSLLIAALEAGPDDGSFAVESLVTPGLIVGQPTPDRGVLNVELDRRAYAAIVGNSDKRQAIAQIVVTLTSNLVGVGQVAFFIDGELITVPTDRGTVEQATRDDFLTLLAGTPSSSAEPETVTSEVQPSSTIG